ncbi:HNH endonuclease [Cryobacterium sp. MDB2-A-2]|nr:HNH endonuclease [Cryobacterium sp. MDB2-A-1]TFC12824.1 HNH endonuclease [Cryobacterium sp. MDB2-A-2]
MWKRQEATQVDHIDGLGPNGPRGFDNNNLQALSASHHSRKTASRDGGFGNPKRSD